jgi:hypothetical protein
MSGAGATVSLSGIFRRLRAVLRKYEGPLEAQIDRAGRYELWSVKDVVIDGRPKKQVFFASLIVQSDYVGFYFMPVYADSELASVFTPELAALRRGKSCFHIKALDARLEKAVGSALRKGFSLYKKRGWA